MVLRAVGQVSRHRKVGMLLVGDGPTRWKLDLLAERIRIAVVLPRINARDELATLVASADALIHGCEAETFCMVAAEARASGIPLIVPHRGAAVDQLIDGAGTSFRAASEISLERAIVRFIDRGPELQRAAAVRASRVRTMDDHFAELFSRYEALAMHHSVQPAMARDLAVGELALASGSQGT
jgi:alpha-1,6-mannosyltransferase